MGEHEGTSRRGRQRVTTEVLLAVADREGVDPLELSPPLHAVVDADAIEALFAGVDGDGLELEFTYADHRITVAGPGDVSIETA